MATYNYLTNQAISQFITNALAEDVRDGDHSSLAAIPSTSFSKAILKIKGNGIIAGIALAEKIFDHVDPRLELELYKKDGDPMEIGQIAFQVSGPAQSIPTAERLVLNCMQRMSGIATYTHKLASMIAHTPCRLLDTRKTTPNFRICEKWAVKIGGGTNHRYGLFDMIMLKDNHVDFAGGIVPAIMATKDYLEKHELNLDIEIEVRNLIELEQTLDYGGVQRIMLDNFPLEMLKEAIKMVNNSVETEASGGITETTIIPIAETGVDFISVGALTHSAKSIDLSLKALV
jgi:nicotinate-nucleotide pyrophosphorylase (carboxylating)